jgi:hypothetical protein
VRTDAKRAWRSADPGEHAIHGGLRADGRTRVPVINVYGESLGAEDRKMLSSVRFDTPSRSVPSLGLPDANASEVLHAPSDPERERAAHEAAVKEAPELPSRPQG